jgi:hypothetical protein
VASNRERANRSINNKISNIDSRLQQSDKGASSPHLDRGAISGEVVADSSITESLIFGRTIGPESVSRGAIGTEHLGIVNQINSDSNLTVNFGQDGRILLGGGAYETELPPTGGRYTLAVNDSAQVVIAPNIPGTGPAGNVVFSAWRSAGNVTVPAVVVFNVVEANIGNAYNSSTGIFTAPVTGRYYFQFYSLFGNVAGTYRVYFYKNNAVYNDMHLRAGVTGTNYDGAHGRSIILSLAAGDTMRMYFSEGTSTLFGTGSYSMFSGYLLG